MGGGRKWVERGPGEGGELLGIPGTDLTGAGPEGQGQCLPVPGEGCLQGIDSSSVAHRTHTPFPSLD